jgi:hypothetical protein
VSEEQDSKTQADMTLLKQRFAAQMQDVAHAQQFAAQTLHHMTQGEHAEEYQNQSEKVTRQIVDLLTDGTMSRVTIVSTMASVIASICNGINEEDTQAGRGIAIPEDVFVMGIGMMAQHMLRCHRASLQVLDEAVDTTNAN